MLGGRKPKTTVLAGSVSGETISWLAFTWWCYLIPLKKPTKFIMHVLPSYKPHPDSEQTLPTLKCHHIEWYSFNTWSGRGHKTLFMTLKFGGSIFNERTEKGYGNFVYQWVLGAFPNFCLKTISLDILNSLCFSGLCSTVSHYGLPLYCVSRTLLTASPDLTELPLA